MYRQTTYRRFHFRATNGHEACLNRQPANRAGGRHLGRIHIMQAAPTHHFQATAGTTGWCIHAPFPIEAGVPSGGAAAWRRAAAEAAEAGFDSLWIPFEWLGDADDAFGACIDARLRLTVDVDLRSVDAHAESVQRSLGGLPEGLDVSVLIRSVNTRPVETWQDLFAGLRTVRPGLSISIWTPGMTPSALQVLEDIEIDAVYSSLPWWDFRAAWLMEEYERLRAVAPVVAPLADPRASQDFESADMLRRLAVASVVGDGVLVPGTMPEGAAQLAPLPVGFPPERRVYNGAPHPPRRVPGLRAELTALFRAQPGGGRLLLLNPSRVRPGALRRGLAARRLRSEERSVGKECRCRSSPDC